MRKLKCEREKNYRLQVGEGRTDLRVFGMDMGEENRSVHAGMAVMR